MNQFVEKYFEHTVDYPKDKLLDILPWNTLWEYVASDFLNGFINYAQVISAVLVARYRKWDEKLEWEVNIMEPPNSFQWTKFSGTKEEVFNKLTEEGRVCHSKFSDFGDDVVVLSKIADKKYILFWYDCDVSDCTIGRFETEVPEEDVKKDFREWLLRSDGWWCDFNEMSKEIPLHYFEGWLSR